MIDRPSLVEALLVKECPALAATVKHATNGESIAKELLGLNSAHLGTVYARCEAKARDQRQAAHWERVKQEADEAERVARERSVRR